MRYLMKTRWPGFVILTCGKTRTHVGQVAGVRGWALAGASKLS
jgi:hypothetical protein